jgi:hypothetical protein
MVRNGDSSSFLNLLEFHVVRSADPSLNDTKMKLAEIYEILNEPRKALELVYEGIPISEFQLNYPYLVCCSSYRFAEETTNT